MKKRIEEGTLMLKRNGALPVLLKPVCKAGVQSEIAVEFSDHRANQKCFIFYQYGQKMTFGSMAPLWEPCKKPLATLLQSFSPSQQLFLAVLA